MSKTDTMLPVVIQRIQRTHGWLVDITRDLDPSDFAGRPAATAPPIGWHLWHISRWADRVAATFPNRDFKPDGRWPTAGQIWFREGLPERWGLDTATLGILQTGAGMAHEAAAALPVGRHTEISAYARAAFAALEAALSTLTPAGVGASRNSVMEYRIDPQTRDITDAGGAETTIAADVGFHLSHSSRHLGTIEGLRGLVLKNGTATA